MLAGAIGGIEAQVRIVFMGTAAFAVPALEAVVAAGEEVVGVCTQPDRPAGRGVQIRHSPVKVAALRLGLAVVQPTSLRPAEEIERLQGLRPDLIVVAAYGLILPKSVLDIPPGGCLNIHASLLPKYRGPSPISGAILAGEAVTGVTIMLIEPAVDSGPILAQVEVVIEPTDTTGSLTEKLARRGAGLLMDVVPAWCRGEIAARPQDHSQATFTRMIRKEDGRIDWALPAERLWRLVRAYQPWPGASTFWQGRLLKVVAAWPLSSVPSFAGQGTGRGVGTVVAVPVESGRRSPAVVSGSGLLRLDQLQIEGRRAVPGEDFLRGYPGFLGTTLG